MNIVNKKARLNYHIFETIEAGIRLTGPEVKSIKEGKVSLEGAHVHIGISGRSVEARLAGMHLARYIPAGRNNPDMGRPRKLLLHRSEILSLWQKSRAKGTTIIPLKIYTKGGWIKVQVALARGRKKWQKREAKKRKDIKRDVERQLRA